MGTTRPGGRAVALALTIAGISAFSAHQAAACGSEYTIRAGDTLGAIASRCDTTVAALSEANGVDPHRLQLGQILSIPGAADGEPAVRESTRRRASVEDTAAALEPAASGYRVERGDTPAKISRRLGVDIDTLLKANPDLDPRNLQIGQVLDVPGTEKVAKVLAERDEARERHAEMRDAYPNPSFSAEDGDWRRSVALKAEGLAPGEEVRIAVSGSGGEWVTLGDMKANDDGNLEATARIPAEFSGASGLTFAMQRPWGAHVVADYRAGELALTRRERSGADTSLAAHEQSSGEPIAVAGKVVRGGDCALLVTAQGNFAVTGGAALRPGDEVEVFGRRASSDGGCTGVVAAIEVAAARLL